MISAAWGESAIRLRTRAGHRGPNSSHRHIISYIEVICNRNVSQRCPASVLLIDSYRVPAVREYELLILSEGLSPYLDLGATTLPG